MAGAAGGSLALGDGDRPYLLSLRAVTLARRGLLECEKNVSAARDQLIGAACASFQARVIMVFSRCGLIQQPKQPSGEPVV